MGDDHFRLSASFDHAGAFGKLMPNAVNLNVDQAFFSGLAFW
jgi:hypothetical protein